MPTKLQDLPVEIIQYTFSFVTIGDAENLLELSFTRERDPEIIWKKVKRYRNIRIASSAGPTDSSETTTYSDPFDALADLSTQDPRILQHDESLDLLSWAYQHESNVAGLMADPNGTEQHMRAVRNWAVCQLFDPACSPLQLAALHLSEDARGQPWQPQLRGFGLHYESNPAAFMRRFEYARRTYHLALLLSILPQLKHLAIAAPERELGELQMILGDMETYFASFSGSRQLAPFKSLQTLKLLLPATNCSLYEDDVQWMRLKDSVDGSIGGSQGLRLEVVLSSGGLLQIQKNTPDASLDHMARSFNFLGHGLDPRMLDAVVERFPLLQEAIFEQRDHSLVKDHVGPLRLRGDRARPRFLNDLVYKLSGGSPISPWYYAQSSVSSALAGYFPDWTYRPTSGAGSSSLERLRIGFRYDTDDFNFLRVFRHTFTRLPNLRVLDATYDALRPSGGGAGHLVEYLPESLEVLKCQNIPDHVSAQRLFHGLKKAKKTKLPGLKRIVVSSPSPRAVQHVRQVSEGFGVCVEEVGVDDVWSLF